jgi:hypothetical protein
LEYRLQPSAAILVLHLPDAGLQISQYAFQLPTRRPFFLDLLTQFLRKFGIMCVEGRYQQRRRSPIVRQAAPFCSLTRRDNDSQNRLRALLITRTTPLPV